MHTVDVHSGSQAAGLATLAFRFTLAPAPGLKWMGQAAGIAASLAWEGGDCKAECCSPGTMDYTGESG